MKQEFLQSIQQVNKLKSKFFQDLVWLIYCQSIKSIEGLNYKFPHQEDISALIEWLNAIEIAQAVATKKYIPLGKYAEQLVKYYLENIKQIKLLAANIQLIENERRTIGELDYLFEDKLLKEYIHLEFSIKYYLKTSKNNQTIYLGPSTKDYLARKMKKLLSHQTTLCQTHQHLLPKSISHLTFQPKAIIKGCLFYPINEWNKRSSRNETNEGWWLNVNELYQLTSTENLFTIITQKDNWIFPFRIMLEFLTFHEFKAKVRPYLKENNEVMVVRYTENRKPIDRGFLMRENWPS